MAKPEKKKAPVGKTTSVRFNPEELEALDLICKNFGIPKRNTALRVLVRAGGGLIETDPEVVKSWQLMGKTLVQQGNLLNQIARAANQGGLVWDKKDDEELQEIRRSCQKLARMLADFTIATRRRSRSDRVLDRALKAFSDG